MTGKVPRKIAHTHGIGADFLQRDDTLGIPPAAAEVAMAARAVAIEQRLSAVRQVPIDREGIGRRRNRVDPGVNVPEGVFLRDNLLASSKG